jgi:hypothetical protein
VAPKPKASNQPTLDKALPDCPEKTQNAELHKDISMVLRLTSGPPNSDRITALHVVR